MFATPTHTNFELCVGSDWHASWARANLEGETSDLLGPDMHVTLGDIVRDKFSDNGLSNYTHWADTALVLGNHDVWNGGRESSGRYDWKNSQATQTELYNRFFAPHASSAKMTIEKNTTWWYREFPEKSMLFIGLNCMVVGDTLHSQQKRFLQARLQHALDNNLRVIIGYHWAMREFKYIPCTFSDNIRYYNLKVYHGELESNYAYDTELLECVDAFIANGGRFVCWMHGHEHDDVVGYYEIGDRKQLCIVVTSELESWKNTLVRLDANVSQVAFDHITVDGLDNITIRRYGAQTVRLGGVYRKEMKITPKGRIIWQKG